MSSIGVVNAGQYPPYSESASYCEEESAAALDIGLLALDKIVLIY